MGTRAAAVYQDFDPSHQLVHDEGIDTLVVELPEFKKEQIRVQLDNFGKLRISGQRPLVDNQWSRFHKDFQVPENCNVTEIQARFENGRLFVKLPKFITEARVKEPPTEAQKPKENEKPVSETKPSTGKEDINQKAPSRPPVEPSQVPKKKEDEKRVVEPTDTRKDAEKVVEKKEEEKIEEKKDKEKVTRDVKQEEVEKVGAVSGVPKEEEATTEREAPGNGQNGLSKLQRRNGELGLGFQKARKPMITVIVAVVVLVGVGLYLTYKLRRPKEKDDR